MVKILHSGIARRRSCVAAAPSAELPPRIKTEEGVKPDVGPSFKNGSGVFKPIPSDDRAVRYDTLDMR